MEFTEVLRRRRMVRRFEQRPVPRETMDRVLESGRRAPSAGFAQGVEFLVLDRLEDIAAFWEITRDPEFGWDLDDIAVGPTVLVLPIPDPARYLERYSQPDKVAFGLTEADRWPVKFWDVDAAMASMLMLLAAVDEGLGAWFFGVSYGERAMLDRFGVPEGLRPIGIMGFGFRAPGERPSGSGVARPRRPFEDQVHRGGW